MIMKRDLRIVRDYMSYKGEREIFMKGLGIKSFEIAKSESFILVPL
jgi:hypothetical protein